MFPFEPFIKVALQAGAHGAFLSGAGPTILAIAGGVGIHKDPGSDTMSQFLAEAVSEAMMKLAKEQGISGTIHITTATNSGLNSVGTSANGKELWSEKMSRGGHTEWGIAK